MNDNLRDRVTQVLNRELLAQLPDALSSGDDLAPSPSGTINLQHLADAVIRELALRLQRDIDGDNEPRGLQPQHRYVTEWEVDE